MKKRGKPISPKVPTKLGGATDAYSNPIANIGFGTASKVNAGYYVADRISLDYQRLLFMYRGSWIVRAVVDTFAEDMLKDFPEIVSQIEPEEIDGLNRVVDQTLTLPKLVEACKWGRLFGGALAIIMLKGSDQYSLEKPLKIEDVLPDTYRGLIVVDRWSGVSPSMDLITDLDNPAEYGLPVYYDVTTEVGTTFRVHHSRVLRFTGRDLPIFEKQIQTYWGMSELEAVVEELKRRDYTASSIADLVSRSQVLVFKEPMLAQLLAGVNVTEQQYNDYVSRMSAVSQSIATNGILTLSEEGELQSHTYSFGGLAEIYNAFLLDISGACQIPVSRLYGRTITGLGQSGEGDLQVYYDTIEQKRKRELRPIFNKLLPVICMSTWGMVPDDLNYKFPPVRTMSNNERADLADKQSKPIIDAYNAGIIGRKTALQEYAQMSDSTGSFSNITDDMINSAEEEPQAMGESLLGEPGEEKQEPEK
jgi:phage-related protein (TIGR01555 family)